MKRILGSIRRADEKFHMIEDGDKICIGVSGGNIEASGATELCDYRADTLEDALGVILGR